jgi:hypothetical protein
MMKCSKCGTEYEDSYKFCPSCGEANPGQVQRGERTPPPPTTSNKLQALEKKKGGFKKFWSDLPTIGKALLIVAIVLLVTGGVVAGIMEANKSSGDSSSGDRESASGMYTFKTATMMLNPDGTFEVAEYNTGVLSSGTWDTDGSSVTTASPAFGVKSASYEIEGEGLRASDGDLWEKQ